MKTRIRLKDLPRLNLRFRRRRYRFWLIVLGIVATVVTAFNFWFIDHAESALEQIVERQSKGRLKLKVDKFRFNWIKNRIELQQALFYSTDSSARSLYNVNVKRITIKARGFLPLLFKKQILIDSIHLYTPAVTITRLNRRARRADRNKGGPGNAADEKFSVALEMGKVSNSINDAINELKINRFILDDGSLSLIDNTRPQETPFVVNKIDMRLNGLQVDSTTSRKNSNSGEKIPFTDEIYIRSHDQNIIFPGNRYMLSFKNFKFTLQDQRVEFDSCTIRGTKDDSSKSAFKIYFDKLRLTNINFDTLYHEEVVQADSVYSTNPNIFLDIDSDQKTARHNNKKIQKIDDLLQQLFGDVMLNYVIVQNAGININTIRKGKVNTFSSSHNNFELQGLMIRQSFDQMVKVDKFLMTLHNYETRLQDGRYALAFDSIQFLNDAINLTKFSFKEYDRGKLVNNIQMPRFELRGLSWESLLYDNFFSAGSALFLNPEIEYSLRSPGTKKDKSIFHTLSNIGSVMNLDALSIQNGDIRLNLGKNATLNLVNANLSVMPDELTASRKVKHIRHSIKVFNFNKGLFKKGALSVTLNQAALDKNKGIRAASMAVQGNSIQAAITDARIGDLILDSTNQRLSIFGIRWQNADIRVNKQSPSEKAPRKRALNHLLINDLDGKNTTLRIHNVHQDISGHFQSLAVKELRKNKHADIIVKGLALKGSNLLVTMPGQRMTAGQLMVNDTTTSTLHNFVFEKTTGTDSIRVKIPQITFVPYMNRIINGTLQLQTLTLADPDISGHFEKKEDSRPEEKKQMPEILLGDVLLQRPKLELRFVNKKNEASTVRWDGVPENSYLRIHELTANHSQLLNIGQLQAYLTNFEFLNNSNGNRFATNYNKLNITLDQLKAGKNDAGTLDWSTLLSVHSMDQLVFDSLGKKNAVLKLDTGEVRNIALNSRDLRNIGAVIRASDQLYIGNATGSYTTAKNRLHWYNFNFNKGFFKVDSFNLAPVQSIGDYQKAKAFNEDYLTLNTGTISGGPFDNQAYGSDSILKIGALHADAVKLLSFKDKTQPDTAKKYKGLPVKQILNIPIRINIDTVGISNAYVEYREINPVTNKLGIIPVNNLNALLYPVRNYGLRPSDSLYICAQADVLGALSTRLSVQQSYTDSLERFRMQLHTGPLDLKKWNQSLLPLVSAEVLRGQLDSLDMTGLGNEDYSSGSMRMYYQGLKLRLMNRKDQSTQRFSDKLISWAANALILRKNNKGKNAPVFFERLKDKSPINFLIKSALEGIKSSIGIPGVRGKERRYIRKTKH
ncbi:hypothetical protein [Niabella drilacis]|uniref:Uncharacterized protein n=1 Tax=Niabella drilacis (strain DSM 25811 / CCM 8410 / CCUG 62505 / LMG 26954 / E90) TaxID=1285928 RepID=A0A1G6T029_NIADE|nr:hypothetical protein [Niabella drilacis]SDD22482.1 hypothetical protein SAMN04487894_10744 [Niabella drilacis]